MHSAAFFVALAFTAFSAAWPQSHGNLTTIAGSASSTNTKPSLVNTGSIHTSSLPSGPLSSTRIILSTGVPGPKPSASASGNNGHQTTGASGTGHGNASPTTTQGPPSQTIHVTVPGLPSTSTQINLISTTLTTLLTVFVPCSTPVATQSGTTYYSSSLTTSVITSATSTVITEYTIAYPEPTTAGSLPSQGSESQDQSSSSGGNGNAGSAGEICAPASTIYHTVYVTVTVTGPTAGSQTIVSGSSSSPRSSNPHPQPPFQSQPNGAPYPQPSSHPSAPFPSGSGTGIGRPITSTQPLSTGAAKPTGSYM